MLISGEMEISPVSSLPLETFSSNTSCGNRFKVTWNVLLVVLVPLVQVT